MYSKYEDQFVEKDKFVEVSSKTTIFVKFILTSILWHGSLLYCLSFFLPIVVLHQCRSINLLN
jgi:hypothetical protein